MLTAGFVSGPVFTSRTIVAGFVFVMSTQHSSIERKVGESDEVACVGALIQSSLNV
jgi:hypothetical protein